MWYDLTGMYLFTIENTRGNDLMSRNFFTSELRMSVQVWMPLSTQFSPMATSHYVFFLLIFIENLSVHSKEMRVKLGIQEFNHATVGRILFTVDFFYHTKSRP